MLQVSSPRTARRIPMVENEPTERLHEAYRVFSHRLSDAECKGELRWQYAKQLASLRADMRRAGVPPHAFAVGVDATADAMHGRCDFLLGCLMALFRDPALPGFGSPSAKLVAALPHRAEWKACEERVQRMGNRTFQEDVLIQELSQLALWIGRDDALEAIDWIRLMRARDNACVIRNALRSAAIDDALAAGPLLSLGAGLCQLEELILQDFGIPITVCDAALPTVGLRPEFRRTSGSAEQVLDGLAAGTIATILIKDALHHFRDPRRLLFACSEVVRPEGCIVLIEPCFDDDDHESRTAMRELDCTDFKESICCRRLLADWIASAGLTVTHMLSLAPSKADNNDCFPRIFLVLKRGANRTGGKE